MILRRESFFSRHRSLFTARVTFITPRETIITPRVTLITWRETLITRRETLTTHRHPFTLTTPATSGHPSIAYGLLPTTRTPTSRCARRLWSIRYTSTV